MGGPGDLPEGREPRRGLREVFVRLLRRPLVVGEQPAELMVGARELRRSGQQLGVLLGDGDRLPARLQRLLHQRSRRGNVVLGRQPRPRPQRPDLPRQVAQPTPELPGPRVRGVRLGRELGARQRLRGEVRQRRVVLLLRPVRGQLGSLQPALGGVPVVAEGGQAVAQPPQGLHHHAVAVRLGRQVRQRGLHHLRRLRPAPLPVQQAAEAVPRVGAQRGALTGLVGPVRGLQRVVGGLGHPRAAVRALGQHLAQLQVEMGVPGRRQRVPAVLQRGPQVQRRRLRVVQVVGDRGQPRLVLHRVPGQPGLQELPYRKRQFGHRLLGGPGQVAEHRVRLGGPGDQVRVLGARGVLRDEGQHLAGRLPGPFRGLGLRRRVGLLPVRALGEPQQHPGPGHQHGGGLPHPGVPGREQRQALPVRGGDVLQGPVELAGQRPRVHPAGPRRQRLAQVARLGVQRGRGGEQVQAVGAQGHRPVLGDLRAVPRGEHHVVRGARGTGPARGGAHARTRGTGTRRTGHARACHARRTGHARARGGPFHRLPGVHRARQQRLRPPPRLGEQLRQAEPLVRGRPGGGRPRRRPRRHRGDGDPYAQRQALHQRLARHPLTHPVAHVRGAVAPVEGLRQRQRLRPRVRGELSGRPVTAGRPRHLSRAHVQRHQPVHDQRGHRQVVLLARRVPVVGEVRRPLRQQLQRPRLVAGERAELHVLGVGGPHALRRPHQAETAQVVRLRLVEPAQPQQRQQRGRQHVVRLVGAGEAALQDRTPHLQRLRVVAARHLPPALPLQLAGVAVGHPVPVRRHPRPVGALRPLQVADVTGDVELAGPHGPLGVARQPVAALHLLQPVLHGVQRDVRLPQHPRRHPLEAPEQRVRLVRVEVLRPLVPHPQQPGERHERLVLLRAVVVDGQLVAQCLDHGQRYAERLGVRQQLLGPRVARRALGPLAVLRDRAAQLVQAGDGSQRTSSSGSPCVASPCVAHSSRPRNARLSSAVSAGRSGRCAMSSA